MEVAKNNSGPNDPGRKGKWAKRLRGEQESWQNDPDSRKSVVIITDRLDMTIVVDWDVKPQNKESNKSMWSVCVKIHVERYAPR